MYFFEKIEKIKYVKCKHDNKIFYDVENKTGSLTKHLNKINVNFVSLSDHFDFFESEQSTKYLKCPLCNFQTKDFENKSGIFTRHINSQHNESIDSFCDKFNSYTPLWSKHFNMRKYEHFLDQSENNKIQCEICGEYFKKLTNKHLKKHNVTPSEYKEKFNINSTCSKTTTEKQRKISFEVQFDSIIERVKKNNIIPLFSKNTYSGVNIKHKYKFKCNCCNNIFEDHLDNGREIICRICNPKLALHPNKKFESEIYDFLKQLNINDIVTNDRKTIYPKEIDLFIPSKNLAIECDGIYWHSELYKDKNYHIEKTLLLQQKNIRTIHIFEDEWYEKNKIIKSKLKQILNCNQNQKIYARKCTIKQIDSKLSSDFLNKNHIQGKDSSQIKLGLFFETQLVSVMTFCKPRISLGYKNKNDFFELSRFCSDINLNVIGGAGKLLKYFILNFNPPNVITYADLRFTNFENNLYTKLNFKKISTTSPNYFWCKNKKRYHRFNFTKQKLINEGYDPNLSETEIMHQNKYYKIWDCGHLKYELTL